MGKITEQGIAEHLRYFGDDHSVQPSAVSITQATEYGTVYSPDEISTIAAFAHEHGLRLHMDGARLANAAAGLGVSLMDITGGAGVDVLSFGGTKNGMIAGEAVIFFDPELARNFAYRRMQGTQLPSKMRFIAAQFDAMFTNDLWLRNASHANRMAALLGKGLAALPRIQLTQPVQANEVFAIIPREHIAALQNECFFSVWDETNSECRFVASFDTTEEDITSFLECSNESSGRLSRSRTGGEQDGPQDSEGARHRRQLRDWILHSAAASRSRCGSSDLRKKSRCAR